MTTAGLAHRRLTHRGHPTLRAGYVVTRLGHAAVAVVGALTIVFLMLAATGNPARLMLPEDATEQEVAALSAVYGFDEPLPVRYAKFLAGVLTGRFPESIRFGEPAIDLVLSRVPATLQLSGLSLLVGVGVGLALGHWLAATRHPRTAGAVLRVLVALQAVPTFLLALVLVLVFSLTLRLLPTSGYTSYAHLVLPVTCFALFLVPGIARIFRSSLVEGYQADHVTTAVAKGGPARTVRLRHVAANSLAPVLTYIGLQVGGILGGAVVIESVFAYPGVGQLLTNSVQAKDFPVTLAAVTLIAGGYVVTSLAVDLLLRRLDPRTAADGRR